MVAKKLNQILAVEKTVKAKREDELTKLYQNVQKEALVTGMVGTYFPKNEDGEKLPSESKRVQVKVEEGLASIVQAMKEVFNITAVKDATNCVALANVVVDQEVVLKNVPATHLLWMEKKLLSFSELINKLPTLPQDTTWTLDQGQNLYRAEPSETIRTKKVEKWDVIVQPTKEHPAQTKMNTEDVTVGTWKRTNLSGAITVDRKKQLLDRVEKFQKAVKEAREEANQTPVADLATGNIVELIFAP